METARNTVILISADAEWQVVRQEFPQAARQPSPYGEWFTARLGGPDPGPPVIFLHGGWGKIAAAGSTQWAIDRWDPGLLVNLGTCGGFRGEIERGEILLVERTLVYDIVEKMGDPAAAIDHYRTDIDLSWLPEQSRLPPLPHPVRRGLLVSADRDLLCEDLPMLKKRYGAIAGDWETGSIAWIARRNEVRLLALRGVSDLVDAGGGEAYGNLAFFSHSTQAIMRRLLDSLPQWLAGIRS